MKTKNLATIYAIVAASLYAINVPFSKLLLGYVEPTMMAAFLYLGAGLGMFVYSIVSKATHKASPSEPLTKKELPYTIAMVVLDIIAPILLMFGIQSSNASNVSLINNFEIVVTSLIALLVFREVVSKRLWIVIALMTVASVILTFEGTGSFEFNIGSLFVFGACLCWGIENNCTRMISNKSSIEIVVIKGTFSGLSSLIVALTIGESIPSVLWIMCIAAWLCCLWTKHLFLCYGSKGFGSSKNKCLLFYRPVPWCCVRYADIGRKTCNPVLCCFACNGYQHLLYD